MNAQSIALMLYGDSHSTRNALTDEMYKGLADALIAAGCSVESVLYHDSKAEQLEVDLQRFDAVLVWVNPIMEQGLDRRSLDKLLIHLSEKGVYVSTHPETILKIGTKRVLYTTRHMDWGGDTELYEEYDDFVSRFLKTLVNGKIRILKQYRGDGGKGVFKVWLDGGSVRVVHAISGNEQRLLSKDGFHQEFKPYFDNDGLLVNQQWADGIINGMVRCYITGTKVSGFGYQESVALNPQTNDPGSPSRPVSRRYYFSEDCGLFQDLRGIMESKWIPQLQDIHAIPDAMMPMLWDIDLFINDVNATDAKRKYTICEINVSCVSPFPPSSVGHIVRALGTKLGL